MPKYILFDLDGTLTDPYEGIINSFQYALAHFGVIEEDPEKLRQLIGPPLRENLARYVDNVEKGVELYREHFGAAGLYENSLYDGIPELLESASATGFTLAIASSKAQVYVRQIAEHFGIAHFFAFIGGSELDGRRSEKAEVIKYVMEAIGAAYMDSVLMIGDRKHDIIGAKSCKVTSIGVLYGYGTKEELEAAGADYTVETVTELKNLLKTPTLFTTAF